MRAVSSTVSMPKSLDSCSTMPILARQLRPAVPGSSPRTRHLPGIAFPVAFENLDGRRLARPVGTEDREDLAVADVEIQIPHRV